MKWLGIFKSKQYLKANNIWKQTIFESKQYLKANNIKKQTIFKSKQIRFLKVTNYKFIITINYNYKVTSYKWFYFSHQIWIFVLFHLINLDIGIVSDISTNYSWYIVSVISTN